VYFGIDIGILDWYGVECEMVHVFVLINYKLYIFIFCWPCILVHFVLISNFTHFFNVFISLLYMFRATQCSSSGESIVSIHHLVHITLYKWPSGMHVRAFLSDLHTRRPPTQSDIYEMMYWYNWFSWWWALGCSKHVKSKGFPRQAEVALGVPGSLRPQIILTFDTTRVVVRQP